MNDISGWVQDNWYSIASLLVQLTFLVLGLRYARRILRTLRASQEQFGAFLKLSLSDELGDRAKAGLTAHRPTPYVKADWPAASETEAAPERAVTASAESSALTLPEDEPHGGIITWLKAPMGGHGHRVSPWRRVMHWLQAPAGN
jgi:hypothetical protein